MKIIRYNNLMLVLLLLSTAVVSVGASVINDSNSGYRLQTDFPQFRFKQAPALDHIRDNASGLTWDKLNNRLVAIVNSPREIHFFSPDASPLQTVELNNFSDTEAIAHVYGNIFAIINERRMTIVLAKIDSDTQRLNAEDLPQIRIADEITKNNGIEGLTYDPTRNSFFAVKEKSPKMIYQIRMNRWPDSFDKDVAMEFDVNSAWKLPFLGYRVRDFSGIHLDVDSGHFMILSDDSKTIVKVNNPGKFLKRLPLEKLLNLAIPQPEGIVISPDGRLYILSEPNLLCIFNPLV